MRQESVVLEVLVDGMVVTRLGRDQQQEVSLKRVLLECENAAMLEEGLEL